MTEDQGSTRPTAPVRGALRSLGRCELLSLRAAVVSCRALLVWAALALLPLDDGRSSAAAARTLRRTADLERALLARWTGTPAGPAEPLPAGPPLALLASADFRRELLWASLGPWTAGLLVAVPPSLVVYGLFGALVQPFLWRLLGPDNWYGFVPVDSTAGALAAALLGAALAAAGLRLSGPVLARYGAWTARLLDGPDRPRWERRIDELTDRRDAVLDFQAAELRRIERDLHDGAQARLVSLGLTLDRAERLVEADPEAAGRLLGEVRATAERALQDLRDLVHGVLPPVLADRGLPDAVRSLALDCVLDVEVDAGLPGRLPAPVEGAAYFAVAELLANAAKHADARLVRIGLRHADGRLLVTVADDGRGGADPDRGTGLAGVRHRLAAFDGVLTLDSPPGGPTTATLELPCASSSPKTSSSSATA